MFCFSSRQGRLTVTPSCFKIECTVSMAPWRARRRGPGRSSGSDNECICNCRRIFTTSKGAIQNLLNAFSRCNSPRGEGWKQTWIQDLHILPPRQPAIWSPVKSVSRKRITWLLLRADDQSHPEKLTSLFKSSPPLDIHISVQICSTWR